MLSFFLCHNCCHIFSPYISRMHVLADAYKIADIAPLLLSDEIRKTNIIEVVYSAGVLTFTTQRIVTSIVKALNVVHPKARFISVSNFLTYFYIKKSCDAIVINSYCGNFFYREVIDGKLSEQSSDLLETLKSKYKNIVMDSDILNNDTNLAYMQYVALCNYFNGEIPDVINDEKGLIKETIEIEYSSTPLYRKIGK